MVAEFSMGQMIHDVAEAMVATRRLRELARWTCAVHGRVRHWGARQVQPGGTCDAGADHEGGCRAERQSPGTARFRLLPWMRIQIVLLALTDVVTEMERRPVFMVDIGCVDFMTAHMPGDVLMGPHGRTLGARQRLQAHAAGPIGVRGAG